MVTFANWNKQSTTTEVKKPPKRADVYRKGRTSRTNKNKLRKLTKFYEGLAWRSQELKQSKKYPKKTKYFCDRFLTLDNYLKYYPLKQTTDKR